MTSRLMSKWIRDSIQAASAERKARFYARMSAGEERQAKLLKKYGKNKKTQARAMFHMNLSEKFSMAQSIARMWE